ncbi:hypothetical protein BP00DRAFT_430275 [Aspergillus indologenus CBS 114.80]|uniref:Uncharacterized protein n=1 Tax=Aspergillus indologenus CBS 114.80 TaxID=1450541 RepID=A0A2V5J0E7_9EURO|nr:hypothetical protein BP00DRAFT_430275 [Aspergillus indologenus CBS 114.80]
MLTDQLEVSRPFVSFFLLLPLLSHGCSLEGLALLMMNNLPISIVHLRSRTAERKPYTIFQFYLIHIHACLIALSSHAILFAGHR